VNLKEEGPELSRDNNTQDITIADHNPPSLRVPPLDSNIEIIDIPRPNLPIYYIGWIDINIGKEIQIDLATFLSIIIISLT